jgi:hypothetical protein
VKLHWGHGLGVGVALFGAGLLVMVYISMSQKVDLVTDDYYPKELKHQEQIDRSKRTAGLHERVEITSGIESVWIKFPGAMERTKLSGELNFYRPNDRKMDFVVAVIVDSANVQTIQTSSLEKGLWRVKASWKYAREEYYSEEVVIVQ